MASQDLSPEEQEIVRRFRGLRKGEKEAVLASEDAFISFLKTIIIILEMWTQIAPHIRELMKLLRSF
jgi:hypothetical protein